MANPNDTPAPKKPLMAGCQQECCVFGLTLQQALWLAYLIGESVYASGQVTSGRDIMRVIHARWDQMGCPVETLADFERVILGDHHPFALGTLDLQRRAIRALAGDKPIGPLDRIRG